jgi:aromatic-L-amino-acid decarboxylase
MFDEQAECGHLTQLLQEVGENLDQYLRFQHPDAMTDPNSWKTALGGSSLEQSVPDRGIGIEQVVADMGQHLIPNGSAIPKPGCTSFITTGATSIAALAGLSGAIAAPQRLGLTAYNYLEELSLKWMAEMFELPKSMKGIYSSGGSVANLVALGAARQWAFEQIGLDPSLDGVQKPCRIYASNASHHTIHRAAAVLGLGRKAVVGIPVDNQGRMCTKQLQEQIKKDKDNNLLPVAIVANAGTTDTGSIDPLLTISQIAFEHSIWFHVDGAYGLPGILDPEVHNLYEGLSSADSVIVDPHKWLGAPVGIGATFVRDFGILKRAFTQESANYLEGAFTDDNVANSMDNEGIPYTDLGVELSAPSRGAVVWAIIREIGKHGLQERVRRHNGMAREVAKQVKQHPNLELLQEPTLSVCCFRYITDQREDINELNRQIHRQLVHRGVNIPSTTMINGNLVIRPCFVGARTTWHHANDLVEEVIEIGDALTSNN